MTTDQPMAMYQEVREENEVGKLHRMRACVLSR